MATSIIPLSTLMETVPQSRPRSSLISRSVVVFMLSMFSGPLASSGQVTAPVESVSSVRPRSGAGDEFWWSDRFDRVRFTNYSTSYYLLRELALTSTITFFPPMPPPLGAEIPVLGSLRPNGPTAPSQLAAFATDLFYPLLGSRLLAADLPPSVHTQLEAYRIKKNSLQDSLRSRLAELKGNDPESSVQQLALFAEQQEPELAALEATAEKLRLDLRRLASSGRPAIPSIVEANPGAKNNAESPAPPPPDLGEEADAMLYAAYFQEGLSLGQRNLLREGSHELAKEARAALTGLPAATKTPWFYFSPATARIRLPASLPSLLEKNIADYTAIKSGLKTELRELIRNVALRGESRHEAFKKLAASQAPRLAALESLAEDIRRALATLPGPEGKLSAPTLPPELDARIATYRRHKLELLKTLHAMLAEVPAASPSKAASSRRESVTDFNRKQTALVADLNKEKQEIRQALADYVHTTGQAGDPKSIDDLLRDFENARQEQELSAKYRDYQTAVLMPGLSPAQRRLLFDAAVVQLSLPLPAGEKMP